jgi:SAM-dependent methyltransferase
MGEPVTSISPAAAYRIWAGTYDRDANPLVALEQRVLRERLDLTAGERVLDLATGTGRWLQYVVSRGIRGFGMDVCAEMLAVAARKPGLVRRLINADLCALPFADDSAGVAICSFALGYVDRLDTAFGEMARVARRIFISDLHPDAARAGWVRSFRAGSGKYEIEHHRHSRARIESCARAANLAPLWTVEAAFGQQERDIFERAGKGTAFEVMRHAPAILVSAWVRA